MCKLLEMLLKELPLEELANTSGEEKGLANLNGCVRIRIQETCVGIDWYDRLTEYTLTKEDVGQRLAFVYIPMNFEGQEGKSMSAVSQIVKQALPKATNLKIIGDFREGSKVTVTCNVSGGTEGSSRVQWFKTSCSIFEGENGLEAVSTSKIAKVAYLK